MNVSRRHPLRLAALALAGIVSPAILAASSPANAAPHAKHVWRACEFLSKQQISNYTQWQIDSETQKPYDLEGATGHVCYYESQLGTVAVFLPDLGSPYPGNVPGDANTFHRTIDGVDATFRNGTIYMTLGHTDVAVRVIPMDHPAAYQEVEPFAELMIKHAEKYLPH